MKKIIVFTFAGLLLGATSSQAAKLKVAADCTYPPFGYQDANGEIKGFDVDVARAIGRQIGSEVEIICQAWDGMIPGLLAGKYDLISASMSITEERLQSINFSVPYRSSAARFVGLKTLDAKPVTEAGEPNPEGVAGKTIGLQRSSTFAKYIAEKYPQATVSEYDKVDNMILDLQAGRVDLIFAGPIKLDNDFLSKPEGKDYGFVGPEIDDVSYFGAGIGIGIRKADEDLLKNVDGALTAMFKDGNFKAINDKYWSFSVLPASAK